MGGDMPAPDEQFFPTGTYPLWITYDEPEGAGVAMAKRIDFCTSVAHTKATLADIGSAIGPNACSWTRLDKTKTIFGESPDFETAGKSWMAEKVMVTRLLSS
jgi:hypothetical protein